MAKRVGRPEAAASLKRETIMRFLVAKDQAARIRSKAKAMGQTISEYLRSASIPKE